MTEKEIDNLKFMSIGSNCYGMAYMGDQRVRGPIDNVLALKGLSSSISLFEGTLENEILNNIPKLYDKTNPSQNDITFKYENFWIVHNDVRTKKFNEEFHKRIQNFEDFCKNINLPENWFVYNLGQFDVKFTDGIGKGKNTEEPTDYFLNGLEYFKMLNLLDKIIFVGNIHSEPRKDFAKFNSKIIKDLVPYYINITDIQMRHPENNQKEFRTALSLLFPKPLLSTV